MVAPAEPPTTGLGSGTRSPPHPSFPKNLARLPTPGPPWSERLGGEPLRARRGPCRAPRDESQTSETKPSFKTAELIGPRGRRDRRADYVRRHRQEQRRPGLQRRPRLILGHLAHHRLHDQPRPGQVRKLRRRRLGPERPRWATSPGRGRLHPPRGAFACLTMLMISARAHVELSRGLEPPTGGFDRTGAGPAPSNGPSTSGRPTGDSRASSLRS